MYKHRFSEVFLRNTPRKTSFRQDPLKPSAHTQEAMKMQKFILVLNFR